MDNSTLLNHLSKHINLSLKEEDLLLSKIIWRKFKKGQYVSKGGEVSKYINFVISGTLKSFNQDKEGNEHILAFGPILASSPTN